ncbi:peptidase M2 family protein [Corallincola holothuriorum]|uniref:Peptidase M2 family protein n=1 Tax=Corallincola holothuriorum TaxID=2282215 RepID=A0A368NL57_9GAMM|nr:M2 family metallopeptidase [Corallincola holothuriorum]RCU50515.1 peptidase M2 family protein [Corallincola holothuriorum]
MSNPEKFRRGLLAITLASALAACGEQAVEPKQIEIDPASLASSFLINAEDELATLRKELYRAEWIYQNFITEDTASLAADANSRYTAAQVRLAHEAAKFDGIDLAASTRRKLDILKFSIVLPAPADADKNAELAKLAADLNGMYGKGKYCLSADNCLTLPEMSNIMASSRDADELLALWQGWRDVSPPMKPLYERQVSLANEGAKALGFNDLGTMWRSNYDMSPTDFSVEMDRLWGQVKPLYEALHCHVRAKLGETYGTDLVSPDQPIPAHLLGNMWAQTWGNIYNIAAPEDADPGFDLTTQLAVHGYDELKMVEGAERFFTSLGFEPLPDTFWQRSLFTQPADRDVVCHASAWDLDDQEDIRIKMCIQKTGEEYAVIHHELGHNFYQRAYKDQSTLFQNSANDGFHEAIGDTIALSVTPEYLRQTGLLTAEEIPSADKDLGLLMKMAMDKVAFLPFGLLVDKWRWQVFSGEVSPQQYNQAWWQLREEYQGVKAPISRDENAFDPGAKYHVPGNTPYARYFLAHILQFQFHRSLCEMAGNDGPIHRCTIYGNKEVGEKLNAMLAMGASKPWPEALEIVTGSKQMDATAILDYFAPLKTWLDQQNIGRQCGW